MRESWPVRPVHRLPVIGRLGAVLLTLSLLGVGAAATPASVAAGGSCSGYAKYVTPPKTIRVYRNSGPNAGHTVIVRFGDWVKHVLGNEMPSYYPREALRANALFVKQYGWYYSLAGHWRGGRDSSGACYDVNDAGDGWYVPEQRGYTQAHEDAVVATWDYTIRKWKNDSWRFILTGYRAGPFVSCGADSDGWHLFQHSAFDCGKDGKTWQQMVAIYVSRSRIVYRWA